MRSLFWTTASLFSAVAAQQSKPTSICVAGQCLEGAVNATALGATVSASNATYLLLPGQYSAANTPDDLARALAIGTTTVTLVEGFSNSTNGTSNVSPTLPLDVALRPGVLSYPSDLYVGTPDFVPAPSAPGALVNGTSISRGSLVVAPGMWAAIEANNGGTKQRTIIWDSFPFVSQLPPSMAGTLAVVDIQSSSCQPACSSSATCSKDGKCVCPTGFTGSSCESCEAGRFGPDCQTCPTNCETCDEGINGSGTCLKPALPAGAPSNCDCDNGTCDARGQCTCLPGWANPTGTGRACSTCAPGFFRSSSGNCQACGRGCTSCSDGSGFCSQCPTGTTPDGDGGLNCVSTDRTCRDGFFRTDPSTPCTPCSSGCAACTGRGPTQCLECTPDTVMTRSGECVVPSNAGACPNSQLFANTLQGICDTCPEGCASCRIPGFQMPSSFFIDDVECAACLPGFVLNEGKCVESCPDGTTTSPDGLTCIACASECATCAGNIGFCTSCSGNQLANNGRCTQTCPPDTFRASGSNSCTSCHPDCATCSGGAFNQCSSCPSSLPVLSSGRCLPTCSKTEFFDTSSGSCRACDASCGSCSAAGQSGCLSCSDARHVLRAGTCVDVNCGSVDGSDGTVIPGLGVCLVELVQVPDIPEVVIPPLDTEAQDRLANPRKPLEWWQILLMVLGGLFIVAVILFLWRRHARKKRAGKTKEFKTKLEHSGIWKKFWRSPFSSIGGMFKRKPHGHARKNTDDKTFRDMEGGDRSSWGYSDGGRSRGDDYAYPERRRSWVGMEERSERRPSIDQRSFVTGSRSGYGDYDRAGPPRSRDDYGSEYLAPPSRAPKTSSSSGSRDRRQYRGDDRDRESHYARSIDQRTEYSYEEDAPPLPSRRYENERSHRSRRDSWGTSHHHSDYAARSRRPEYHHHRGAPSSSGDLLGPSISQRADSPSVYSEVPRYPQPKQPYKDLLTSRYSGTSYAPSSRSKRKPPPPRSRGDPDDVPSDVGFDGYSTRHNNTSDAELYKLSKLFPRDGENGPPKIVPVATGGSQNNPFRKPSY